MSTNEGDYASCPGAKGGGGGGAEGGGGGGFGRRRTHISMRGFLSIDKGLPLARGLGAVPANIVVEGDDRLTSALSLGLLNQPEADEDERRRVGKRVCSFSDLLGFLPDSWVVRACASAGERAGMLVRPPPCTRACLRARVCVCEEEAGG